MSSNSLSTAGFEIVSNFMSAKWIHHILHDIEQTAIDIDVSGIRRIDKKLSSVSAYLASVEFTEKAKPYLNSEYQLVRAILFKKTSDANWYVTWHQDRTVSVSEKFANPEWKTWSVKEGVLHAQPPLAVLENMVTIRIHLDNATRDNGCLKVISGSHQNGLFSQDELTKMISSEKVVYCEASAGDALIMRPLLLHASSKSTNPSTRRVLHLEFSNWQLPNGIYWG